MHEDWIQAVVVTILATPTTTTDNYDIIAQHHVLLVASRYETNMKQTWTHALTCLPISVLTSLSSSKSLLLPTNSSTRA